MANIRVELSHEIMDGQPVTFVAPCDCTEIDGLKVYYPGGSKVFVFKDAHGNALTGIGNLFSAGAYVKAILDVTNGFAYIQNADTNGYIESTKATVPKMATGSIVTVGDSGDASLLGLKLFSKTTQSATTGKNLATAQMVYKGANNYAEVTEDGRNCIKFQSDKSANNAPFVFKENTQYTVSFYVKTVPRQDGTMGENAFCFYYTDGTSSMLNAEHEQAWKRMAITSKAGKTVEAIGLYGFNYLSYVYVDIDTFQIEEGTSKTEYEPYTGGAPSPSQDYPQALETVGASGGINTMVAGKNLLAPDMITINGSTALRVNEITLYAGVPYVFSSSTNATALSIRETDFTTIIKVAYEKNIVKYTPTTTKKVTLDAYWNTAIPSGATIQLEIGNAETEHAEGVATQTLTASTPNGLPGNPLGATIPDSIKNNPVHMAGVWWDEETQQYYVSDTKDCATGMHVQRVYCVTFDGTEPWSYLNQNGVTTFTLFLGKPGRRWEIMNTFGYKAEFVYAKGNIFIANTNTDCLYIMPYGDYTVDTWKQLLAEKAAAGTPLAVQYVLITPIETPLSAEEMAQYAALHTNKPNTTVFNDSGAYMEIRYCAPNTAVPMNLGSGRAGDLLVVDEEGRVVTSPKSSMPFAPAKKAISGDLSAVGWYRVGEVKTYNCYRLSVSTIYNQEPDMAAIIDIVTPISAPLLHKTVASFSRDTVKAIDQIRLVQSSDRKTHYVDIHYSLTSENRVCVMLDGPNGWFTPYPYAEWVTNPTGTAAVTLSL